MPSFQVTAVVHAAINSVFIRDQRKRTTTISCQQRTSCPRLVQTWMHLMRTRRNERSARTTVSLGKQKKFFFWHDSLFPRDRIPVKLSVEKGMDSDLPSLEQTVAQPLSLIFPATKAIDHIKWIESDSVQRAAAIYSLSASSSNKYKKLVSVDARSHWSQKWLVPLFLFFLSVYSTNARKQRPRAWSQARLS